MPEKIPGQYQAVGAVEAKAENEVVISQSLHIELTLEDHSIFQACVFTSPDWFMRALIKCAAAGTALSP